MTKHDTEIREKIMDATIELIKQHGDTTLITVRNIAAKVGVGVGLINYHFQTKENLINQCLIKAIGQTINHFETLNQNPAIKAIDKLRELAKGIAAFMIVDPGFSRISILNDFVSPKTDDNTAQVIKMFFPLFQEISGDQKNDQELLVLLHMLITSIQVAFLRREVLKETMGIDFSNEEQRDAFIDSCINEVFNIEK